jgi:hypothetical protein
MSKTTEKKQGYSQSLKAPPVDMPVNAAPKERCRFDMFATLKNEVRMNFSNGTKQWCFRGDKFNNEPPKMLRYLLGIVKNHYESYYLFELYDNTKPKTDGERLILKILNGKVKVNRLPDYSELLQNFHLPEYLSYEIKN